MRYNKNFCLLFCILIIQSTPISGQELLNKVNALFIQSNKTYSSGVLFGPTFSYEDKYVHPSDNYSTITKKRFSGIYGGVSLEYARFKHSVFVSFFRDYYRYDLSDPYGYDLLGPNNDERHESISCLRISSIYLSKWYALGLSVNIYSRRYEYIYEKNYRSGGIVHEQDHIQERDWVKLVPGVYFRFGKETLFIEAGGLNPQIFRPDIWHSHINLGFKLPGVEQSSLRIGSITEISSLRYRRGMDLFASLSLPVNHNWNLDASYYHYVNIWDGITRMDGIMIGFRFNSSKKMQF